MDIHEHTGNGEPFFPLASIGETHTPTFRTTTPPTPGGKSNPTPPLIHHSSVEPSPRLSRMPREISDPAPKLPLGRLP
jgi:hypothetical protein